jgi:hypothetical protein
MLTRALFLIFLLCSAFADAHVISQHELNIAYKTPFKSANAMVNKMTNREKIGQLMLVDFRYWKKNDASQNALHNKNIKKSALVNIVSTSSLGNKKRKKEK